MAVRGIVATIDVFPADYDFSTSTDPPLYSFQNYFPGNRTILGVSYAYNSFQCGNITKTLGAGSQDVSVTFVGTAANVDLVEAAVQNSYIFSVIFQRWSAFEGLENPTDFNILSLFIGVPVSGSADLSTVSLQISTYNNTLNTDLPWRKIPWTILGPLSFRR